MIARYVRVCYETTNWVCTTPYCVEPRLRPSLSSHFSSLVTASSVLVKFQEIISVPQGRLRVAHGWSAQRGILGKTTEMTKPRTGRLILAQGGNPGPPYDRLPMTEIRRLPTPSPYPQIAGPFPSFPQQFGQVWLMVVSYQPR